MDKLSTEVLIYIFEFLNSSAIQNVMEVSKKWSNIVMMTSSIKSKLSLTINANTCEEMTKKSQNFPYQSINVTSNTIDDASFTNFAVNRQELLTVVEFEFIKNIETVFMDHSRHLSVLEMTNMNNIFVAKMLSKCRFIKELRLNSVNESQFKDNFYSQDIRTPEIINLRRLKFLEVKSSTDVFSRIEAPHVETLILHDDPGFDVLRNFLLVNWDLKDLQLHEFHLRSVRRPQTFKFKLEKLNFKLKNHPNLFRSLISNRLAFELIVQNFRNNVDQNIEQIDDPVAQNRLYLQHVAQFRIEVERSQQEYLSDSLLNFLAQHQDSLRELTMNFDGLDLHASRIMDIIFGDLKLEKLSIKSSHQTLNFMIRNVSRTIKKFEIIGFLSILDVQELFEKVPELTKLRMNIESRHQHDFLNTIVSHMPKLKELDINTFFTHFSLDVKFENVEKLTIHQEKLRCRQQLWKKIAYAFPNVKNLTLTHEDFNFSPIDFEKVLKKLTKLESLKIIGKEGLKNLENICKVFLDQSFNVKDVRIIGEIDKDEFYERIEAVTKAINIKITVIYAKTN